LTTLLRNLRASGRTARQVRLAGFGEVRMQLEFAHLCGEIEYSKPPEKKDEQPNKEGSGPDANKDEKPEKPFVPRPLRPAPSSNARQAIERAIAAVPWVRDSTYHDYHTKPEFNGPRKLILTLTPPSCEAVRLGELLAALSDAGFPPSAVTVSRLFPGLAFGHPLPRDLELVTAGKEKRLLSSIQQPGRPLVIAFLSLNCPKWDKYKYEPEPSFYRQLKQTIESYRDRVDFVAISSNPDDELPKVAEFAQQAELRMPLLHDANGQVRSVLNAQITPAPHIYIFDAECLLRYAGDAHDNWEKPGETQNDFLAQSLDLVLTSKFAANAAVFFNSSKCNCSSPNCKCPKCGCGPSCRCDIKH
jgi:hypothetical protein